MKRTLCVMVFLWSALIASRAVFPDTVIMLSGREIKGVVVEEYTDRVVLSTADGEKEIMRDGIQRILYDLEEQNLTALGDHYRERGAMARAHYFYGKALEENPDFERARDGFDLTGSYLQQRRRLDKLDHISRLEEEDLRLRGRVAPERAKDMADALRESLGLVFEEEDRPFEVTKVIPGSPAASAGLEGRDVLVSCWGRYVRYMPPEEVYRELVRPGMMEVKVTVTRELDLDLGRGPRYSDVLGAELDHDRMRGLFVKSIRPGGAAERAGLEEGDLVLLIRDLPTRYMPKSDVAGTIRSQSGGSLPVKVERAFTIWRSF